MKKDASVESMVDASPVGKENDGKAGSPNCVVGARSESFSPVDWFLRHFHDSSPGGDSSANADSDSETDSHPDPNSKLHLQAAPHPIQTLRVPPRPPRSASPPKDASPALRSQREALGSAWNARGLHSAQKEQWDAAVECWQRALNIRIDTHGQAHTDVANTLNNLGIAYGQLARHDDANASLQRALKIRIHLHGRHHEDVAATLHNLGNLRQATHDAAGALTAFNGALAIQRRLLGEADPKVARAFSAIGHVHFSQKDYPRARDAYRSALDTLSRADTPQDDAELRATTLDLQEADELANIVT